MTLILLADLRPHADDATSRTYGPPRPLSSCEINFSPAVTARSSGDKFGAVPEAVPLASAIHAISCIGGEQSTDRLSPSTRRSFPCRSALRHYSSLDFTGGNASARTKTHDFARLPDQPRVAMSGTYARQRTAENANDTAVASSCARGFLISGLVPLFRSFSLRGPGRVINVDDA